MHRVGEVDGGRPARQRQDLALGREHVDLVGEEIYLEVLEELGRVARLRLDLEQALQPLVGLLLQLGERGVRVLVELVRGDPRLCDLVDRKSTRLNSSHSQISYAVFCLKKKKKIKKKKIVDQYIQT